YGRAVKRWEELMRLLAAGNSPQLKDAYQEANFYRVRAYVHFALSHKDAAKGADALKKAAGMIVQVETNSATPESVKERFQELLQAESRLKEQYMKAKEGTPK